MSYTERFRETAVVFSIEQKAAAEFVAETTLGNQPWLNLEVALIGSFAGKAEHFTGLLSAFDPGIIYEPHNSPDMNEVSAPSWIKPNQGDLTALYRVNRLSNQKINLQSVEETTGRVLGMHSYGASIFLQGEIAVPESPELAKSLKKGHTLRGLNDLEFTALLDEAFITKPMLFDRNYIRR